MSKVKKIFKAISLVLATALIALVPVGCNGNGGSESGRSGGNPKLPAFDREIDRRRGKTQVRNDYCKYIFKNGINRIGLFGF